jgi:integrase
MAFRHALRVSELVGLRWQQIHLDTATIHITRAKNGTAGNHGLQGDELRPLRALRREHPRSDFVFLSRRRASRAKVLELFSALLFCLLTLEPAHAHHWSRTFGRSAIRCSCAMNLAQHEGLRTRL